MATITKFILTENLVDAKNLIESLLAKIVSEHFDAKKVQVVAERFNSKPINWQKFLKPRLSKASLKESIQALNESTGYQFNQVMNQHGFDLDRRSGHDHEYVNYTGHEVHVNHGTGKWKHYDAPGYEVNRGIGHESLHDHLSRQNLDSNGSKHPDDYIDHRAPAHIVGATVPHLRKQAFGESVWPEKEHPYTGLAKEFGFKQEGPGQIRTGITTYKFGHPTNATLKLMHHHDSGTYSFEHAFGSSKFSGAGKIQLENRLKTFHNKVSEQPSDVALTQEESNFKKLVNKLEKKGEPESEAKGVAAKVGFEKYGKAGMEARASAGRRKAQREGK